MRNDEIKKTIEINKLKKQLAQTDYKIIKYVEGKISKEEFEEISMLRQQWRDKINELTEENK